MSKLHSEFTRVQVPAALHLERLGYQLLTELPEYDHRTNILTGVFRDSLRRLNPEVTDATIDQELAAIVRILDNDDLGREFYQKLSSKSGLRYIDYDDPKNNIWQCALEFTCEDKETGTNFRPDITCFINGLPVVFIEVKKPNNHDGILAERDRMNKRMRVRKFRRFLNLTQLMIFSNNQEYDNENRVPIQGAFYASITRGNIFFNVFREQTQEYYERIHLQPTNPKREQEILSSFNIATLSALPEYRTNCSPTTPTNRVISSLLAKERILFILRYGFAYVENNIQLESGENITTLEKHVMRYQQMFASLAIRRKLDHGVRSGIIWHTQGSGKTALAFYSVKFLTDYYAARQTAVKFYFIVDRLDLMEQAVGEFEARGLKARTANSRAELMEDFRKNSVIENKEGKPEIMVVNIQKFEEDHAKIELPTTYGIHLQRVFFIDEAHRGYNPTGSFLANLMDADKDAIKIALTGTPLLKEERASWKVFGDYIDKYYYDKSIADGYTLRLMREEIETSYKEKLLQLIEETQQLTGIEAKKSDVAVKKVIESDNYLKGLIDYVSRDLRIFRKLQADETVAGMIVCETNEQARNLFNLFLAHEAQEKTPLKAELILHDEKDKGYRKEAVKLFKKTTELDLLIVNKMLLTGFDANRLKRLYLTRKMKDHDLLQALTRVNRPYKNYKYGYVVDFAGIKENFDETNNRYLQELNRCNTDDPENQQQENDLAHAILEDKEEIIDMLKGVKHTLFAYAVENTEEFRKDLDDVEDLQQLYDLRRHLENAKALANQIRTYGDDELRQKYQNLQLGDIPNLLSEVNHRIDRLNQKSKLDHDSEVEGAVNYIISELEYSFKKIGQEELRIATNDLQDEINKVNREFEINFDRTDQNFVNLFAEFRAYFRKHDIVPQNVAEAHEGVAFLGDVLKRIRKINRENDRLRLRYNSDDRFVRIHKRIREENEVRRLDSRAPIISDEEYMIVDGLNKVKLWIDQLIYDNGNILENEAVFDQHVLQQVSMKLVDLNVTVNLTDRKFIRRKIADEYMGQFRSFRENRYYAY